MKDDGGPAFPQPQVQTDQGSGIVSASEMGEGGMSLRDYFATHASENDVAHFLPRYACDADCERDLLLATARYKHADAMLAARKK